MKKSYNGLVVEMNWFETTDIIMASGFSGGVDDLGDLNGGKTNSSPLDNLGI